MQGFAKRGMVKASSNAAGCKSTTRGAGQRAAVQMWIPGRLFSFIVAFYEGFLTLHTPGKSRTAHSSLRRQKTELVLSAAIKMEQLSVIGCISGSVDVGNQVVLPILTIIFITANAIDTADSKFPVWLASVYQSQTIVGTARRAR